MSRADSQTGTHRPNAEPGSVEYKEKVAQPVMDAVDHMPKAYRELVHEFGYIGVYKAWRRGWSVERIRKAVKDGAFNL